MRRGLRRGAVAMVTALATQLVPLGMTASASPSHLSITRLTETARWTGHFGSAGVVASQPAACVVTTCDERFLELDLRERNWNTNGGLQVGVRWTDEEQDLDLFVYAPDGNLAAKSDGLYASTAESVLITAARNGTYRIVIVPRETRDLRYDGMAQVERGTAAAPVRDLLPDLVVLPPRHATFSTGTYFFSDTVLPTSCYPEETIEDDVQRCLRFDQILGNVGDGPFELRYELAGAATDQQLVQRVFRTDGSWFDRSAGSYEFHRTHAHFHYRNFAVSELWASDEHGRRIGKAPVQVGNKNGFCVTDIENIWFGRHGDAARAYYFPQCNAPAEIDPSSPVLRQGMSVGWGDVYNWFLPDQYIEVSDIPDGYYLLDTIADADELVLETNENNNRTTALIRICGDAVEIIGDEAACA